MTTLLSSLFKALTRLSHVYASGSGTFSDTRRLPNDVVNKSFCFAGIANKALDETALVDGVFPFLNLFFVKPNAAQTFESITTSFGKPLSASTFNTVSDVYFIKNLKSNFLA